jgi:hypothetical protein
MSQRDSGYERIDRDLYETPEWVTRVLVPHLPPDKIVWEPACGSGKMVRALMANKFFCVQSDITFGDDFLEQAQPLSNVIVTNPPYKLAREFIEHALKLVGPSGFVAMLLRTDFDHAATRQHLFSGCSAFAHKIVLTKRVVWFEREGAAPSFNHAWYIWRGDHIGPPTISYSGEVK